MKKIFLFLLFFASLANATVTSNGNLTGISAGGITALTGAVTASGTGSVAATLAATTNSTLTTLSSLSLPYSQVTGGPAAGATTTLNNLGTTAINADLLFGTPNAIHIGSNASPALDVFANALYMESAYGPNGHLLSITAGGTYGTQVTLQTSSTDGVPNDLTLATGNNSGGNSGNIYLAPGTADTAAHRGVVIFPVMGAGVTPVSVIEGSTAYTSGHILCVYTGAAWKKVSDGSTTCTF